MTDRSFPVVALCFFLSGFAALIYETAWTREFSFVFGTSELAVATVLAAYMAGLASGAAVGGRLALRTLRPVMLYGVLELGVGVAALFVPTALAVARWLLVSLFGGQSGFGETNQLAISTFYLIATFAIVMLPTFCMGATLPLLARHVVRSNSDIGPRIGMLYSVNTVGAVGGTLATAFVLLPSLGIRHTVYVAIAVNTLVFLIAIYLVRIAKIEMPESRARVLAPDVSIARGLHFILPLILLSGALSFTYEVVWIRLLSQLLGGSMYAFATMLASFLLGIALGSAGASRIASSPSRAIRLFAWTQIGIAVLSLAAFGAIDSLPAIAIAWGDNNSLLLDALMAMAVLLPAATGIGATFPLAVRTLAHDPDQAATASARVYSWNTVGAVIGSIGTAFLLLPLLGFRGTMLLAVGLNLSIAAAATVFARLDRKWLLAPVVVGLALAALAPGEPWQVLRSAPLNRSAAPKQGDVSFYAVGQSATVLLTEDSPIRWRLSTNGLPESTVAASEEPPYRLNSAALLGAIGPILRPDARSMLVVGLGGGVTLERIPRNIERIDVIELEPQVVAANRWLGPRRAVDPLLDPRLHLHTNDARSALFLSNQRFDVIAAQASHPWTSGAAHLYSGEFFDLAADHLTDDGVLVQWMGPAYVDADLIKSLVATLLEHFAYVQVYKRYLFVASNRPLPDVVDFEALRTLDPGLSIDTGLYTAEDFATYLLIDSESSSEFAGNAPLITDDRNLLQMRSPMIPRASKATKARIKREISQAFDFYDPLPELVARGRLDGVELVERLKARRQQGRARSLTRSLADPAERELLRLPSGGSSSELKKIEAFLRGNPDNRRARALLLRLRLANPTPDPTPSPAQGHAVRPQLPGGELSPSESAFVEASLLSLRDDWRGVQKLDLRLAKVSAGHPLFLDATFLRANWRISDGREAHGREAIQLIDRALRSVRSQRMLLLRAQAGLGVRDPLVTLASIGAIRPPRDNRDHKKQRRLRDRARSYLLELEVDGKLGAWRDELLEVRFPARRRSPGE